MEQFGKAVWNRYKEGSNGYWLVRYKTGHNPGWYAGWELGSNGNHSCHGPFPTKEWAILAANYHGFGEDLPESVVREVDRYRRKLEDTLRKSHSLWTVEVLWQIGFGEYPKTEITNYHLQKGEGQ